MSYICVAILFLLIGFYLGARYWPTIHDYIKQNMP